MSALAEGVGEFNTYGYSDRFIDNTNFSLVDDITEYGWESEDSDWAPVDHKDFSKLVNEVFKRLCL